MASSLLSRLFKKKKAAHPLATEMGLRALIDRFDRSDPVRFLTDVDEQLATITDLVAQIGVEVAYNVVSKLDQASHAATGDLLDKFLSPHLGHHLGEFAWSRLNYHSASLLGAYHATLGVLIAQSGTAQTRECVGRGAIALLRAWVFRTKLHKFRYRVPALAMWQRANQFMSLLEQRGLADQLVKSDDEARETSPRMTFVRGVYFECLPADILTPAQMELLSRFFDTRDDLVCGSRRDAESSHFFCTDSGSGPARLGLDAVEGETLQFLSTKPLIPFLIKFADDLEAGAEVPHWLFHVPGGDVAKKAGLRAVANFWGEIRDESQSRSHTIERQAEEIGLKVAFGFERVVRVIRISEAIRRHHAAMRDRTHVDERSELVTSEPAKDGGERMLEFEFMPDRVEKEDDPQRVETSFEMLFRLEADEELTGGRFEEWQQTDSSSVGFGIRIPIVLPRHHVGAFIAFRYEDGLQWSVGVLRRITRDAAGNPLAGLEVLGTHALTAHLRLCHLADSTSDVQFSEDGILVERGDIEVITRAGGLIGGRLVDLGLEGGTVRLRVGMLLDRDEDYDRYVVHPELEQWIEAFNLAVD